MLFRSPFWVLPSPLVETTPPLTNMLRNCGPCGNLRKTTQIVRVSHSAHPPLGDASTIQQGT